MNNLILAILFSIATLVFGTLATLSGVKAKNYFNEWLNRLTDEEIERLSPKLDISLYIEKTNIIHPLPFLEYKLTVQNKNENSVQITNCDIEFFFENIVLETKKSVQMPNIGTTIGEVRVSSIKDGKRTLEYEKIPERPQFDNNFFLTIEKETVKGNSINTNNVVFNAQNWPPRAGFFASIIVDLSKKPETFQAPLGAYKGYYKFKIKNKEFTETIQGEIENDKSIEGLINNYSKINKKEGHIEIGISHEDLYKDDNKYLEILPQVKKEEFEISIYKDKDNKIKVNISNFYKKNVILQSENVLELKKLTTHPHHTLRVDWRKGEFRLTIDEKIVDRHIYK